MREESYSELTPREQRDLYKVQLRDAQSNQEIADLKEKIEDVEFHILKFGNTWE